MLLCWEMLPAHQQPTPTPTQPHHKPLGYSAGEREKEVGRGLGGIDDLGKPHKEGKVALSLAPCGQKWLRASALFDFFEALFGDGGNFLFPRAPHAPRPRHAQAPTGMLHAGAAPSTRPARRPRAPSPPGTRVLVWSWPRPGAPFSPHAPNADPLIHAHAGPLGGRPTPRHAAGRPPAQRRVRHSACDTTGALPRNVPPRVSTPPIPPSLPHPPHRRYTPPPPLPAQPPHRPATQPRQDAGRRTRPQVVWCPGQAPRVARRPHHGGRRRGAPQGRQAARQQAPPPLRHGREGPAPAHAPAAAGRGDVCRRFPWRGGGRSSSSSSSSSKRAASSKGTTQQQPHHLQAGKAAAGKSRRTPPPPPPPPPGPSSHCPGICRRASASRVTSTPSSC